MSVVWRTFMPRPDAVARQELVHSGLVGNTRVTYRAVLGDRGERGNLPGRDQQLMWTYELTIDLEQRSTTVC